MAGEGFHAGLARQDGIGAHRLAEALDGGGGEYRENGVTLRMPPRVLPQQALLERRWQIGVGIAQEAGEIIGGGAAAHALEVDHDRLRAAEQDIA